MTSDQNKGITGITYNHLGLPTQITFGSGNIQYTYDATGAKLKKTSGTGVSTEYANGYVYEGGILQFFAHSEGYVSVENGNSSYVYNYGDHLGNIRLSYTDADGNGSVDPANEIIEENNFYPFGLKHKGYNDGVSSLGNSNAKKFKYNGVELEESFGLNLYEMDFRQYDPTLGRFTSIDPVIHHLVSPYTGMSNNPAFWADPLGAYSVQDLIDEASKHPGTKFTSNGDGTFSGGGKTIGEKTETLEEESGSKGINGFALSFVGTKGSSGRGNSSGSAQGSGNARQDCPECPILSSEELAAFWLQNPTFNVAYTSDGKGNYRYYYKDGRIEETMTSPIQKVLQDLTGLWLINSIGKVFKYFGAAKTNNLVKIGEISDDVMIFSSKIGDEVVEGVTNFKVVGDKLFLNQLHLQGSTAGKVGRANLWDMAKDLGRQFGVKEVIIQGGKRTTGKYKGTVPSPVTIKIK